MESKIYQYAYTVYSDGRVYTHIKNKFLKHTLGGNGYLTVSIHSTNVLLHVLLAECFIDNPKKLAVVNHKDGNPLNNRLDNLEWSTQANNVKHAYDTGLRTSYDLEKWSENATQVAKLHGTITNSEIANKLGVSEAYVEKQVRTQGLQKQQLTDQGGDSRHNRTIYDRWSIIRHACDPNSKKFKNVPYCKRLISDYSYFKELYGNPPEDHVLSMRIKSKGYFPDNLKYMTKDEAKFWGNQKEDRLELVFKLIENQDKTNKELFVILGLNEQFSDSKKKSKYLASLKQTAKKVNSILDK